MPTIKTEELSGEMLDLAVAMIDPQCDGLEFKTVNGVMCGVDPEDDLICIYFNPDERSFSAMRTRRAIHDAGGEYASAYAPSFQWERAGPIIQREMLGVMPISDATWRAGDVDGANGFGPTPLIAAMRCYVTSKLGESVEIPAELYQRAAQAAQGGE